MLVDLNSEDFRSSLASISQAENNETNRSRV